jgi:L-aspartate oxidase
MQKYAPAEMELATRDIIAKAIFTEMELHGFEHVYLDMRHLNQAYMSNRFPSIYRTLWRLGLNPKHEMIPVVPAAHYLCGGVLTDVNGKTDLSGLYVIGESAFTGLHGANRLASNSLLEAVVMADNAAKHSLHYVSGMSAIAGMQYTWDSKSVTDKRRASQINAHWLGLRAEMTSYAGIIRTAAGLLDLLKLIQARAAMIEAYYWKHTITRDLLELRNIVLVAELIVLSAINRQESRGGHYRADFPQTLDVQEETIIQGNPYQRKMIGQHKIIRV